MSLTSSQLTDRINRSIHNAKAKLGGDEEIRSILDDANRELRLEFDLAGAIRFSTPFLLFDNIYDYPVPTDFDADKLSKLIYESKESQGVNGNFERTESSYLFDMRNPYISLMANYIDGDANFRKSSINTMAIEFENGSPYLRAKLTSQPTSLTVSVCDSYDGDGTWTAADDATNVRTDTQIYKEGTGSVEFDSSGGATDITIYNSDMTAVDISDIEDKGKLFLWVYLPSTVPASITFYWGSSDSAYWSKSVTTRYNGLAFKEGWNQLGFDWATATETGSPDSEAVDYLKLTLTNTVASAQTGYRLDDITAKLGEQVKMKYYSSYLVSDNDGTRQLVFDEGDDYTVLLGIEENLLIKKGTILALENLREFKEAASRKDEYERLKQDYEDRIKSDREPVSYTYYNI